MGDNSSPSATTFINGAISSDSSYLVASGSKGNRASINSELGLPFGPDGAVEINFRSFEGLWTDPLTGMAYARARWYDARNASWLSEDPLQDVDSPNLYAFVAWQPQIQADPFGLQTDKIEKGIEGEAALVRRLKELGWRIFYGGAEHSTPSGGADAIAWNPETDELAFLDDKNWRKKKGVSRAKSLIENFETGPSVKRAAAAIRSSDLDEATKARLLEQLEKRQIGKYVTAAAEESSVRHVTPRVAEKGVKYLEVVKKRKLASKLGIVGAALAIFLSDDAGYAIGELLEGPLGLMRMGQNTPTTEEELRAIRDFGYYVELGRLLEETEVPPAEGSAPMVPVTPENLEGDR